MSVRATLQARPYDLFMLVLCVLALVALGTRTLAHLSPDTVTILDYADTGVCVVFFLDFAYRLATAENRLQYMKWGCWTWYRASRRLGSSGSAAWRGSLAFFGF